MGLRRSVPLILMEACHGIIVLPENNIVNRRPFLAALLFAAIAGQLGLDSLLAAEKPKGPERWESSIAEFEADDKANPPADGEIMFLGSSSIRMWDVRKWFPNLPVINRGFGGSQIADSLFYAERIVIPRRPRVIVFYAGDNDIAGGKTPEQVFADYQAFVAKIHEHLPGTKIIFVPIKPSISRWKLVELGRKTNRMIEELSSEDDLLDYINIDTPMIGTDGRPRKELFLKDGLHMSDAGYEIWTDLVMPRVQPPASERINCSVSSECNKRGRGPRRRLRISGRCRVRTLLASKTRQYLCARR